MFSRWSHPVHGASGSLGQRALAGVITSPKLEAPPVRPAAYCLHLLKWPFSLLHCVTKKGGIRAPYAGRPGQAEVHGQQREQPRAIWTSALTDGHSWLGTWYLARVKS